MKKCLLLSMTVILLSGCPIGDRVPDVYEHEVTITLKDGIPCFGLADDEEVRSEQVKIYYLQVGGYYDGATPPQNHMMTKSMNQAIIQSGECVPYEGEALENNHLYPIWFVVKVVNQGRNHLHTYNGSFCFFENKNGEKVLHHFKKYERPTSCPVSSDE